VASVWRVNIATSAIAGVDQVAGAEGFGRASAIAGLDFDRADIGDAAASRARRSTPRTPPPLSPPAVADRLRSPGVRLVELDKVAAGARPAPSRVPVTRPWAR